VANNPLVLVHGEIREVTRQTYDNIDPDTGQVTTENRGRKVTVLTHTGFAQVKFPPAFDGLQLAEGQLLAGWFEYVDWNMNGRRGNSLIFNRVASPALVAALQAEHRPAPAEAVSA